VEAQNRELQAAAEAAAADTREVGALVEQHRALEAAHKELQVITEHIGELHLGRLDSSSSTHGSNVVCMP
jgi:hypothetical protein